MTIHKYSIGDRVTKNPNTWIRNDFDNWGRGIGVGVVVEPPYPLNDNEVDVRWPNGRCFEDTAQLVKVEHEEDEECNS